MRRPFGAGLALEPDRAIRLEPTGGMTGYGWEFNGKPLDHKRITHPAR
jgi:hypothetical protein